jgi:DNA-3-methyladenine glycosylase II
LLAVAETQHLTVRGPFSLGAAAEFGFGPTEGGPPPFDGAMRLAFPVDGGQGYAGAVVRQKGQTAGLEVELDLRDGASAEAALRQISRILSLDHDGMGFEAIGRAEPVIGALQHAHPGQRPVLFSSPYEAAAWAVISARRSARQAARVRDELGRQLGESFQLAGRELIAFPQPRHLLELGDQFPGLSMPKLIRLRDVAGAALEGALDPSRLHQLGPERAWSEMQRLPGIGPFYAGLVVLRASGFADALLPMTEAKVLAHTARFYGLPGPPDLEAFAALAERWRPFRTWATVLIRLAGDRGTEIPGAVSRD